MYVFSWFLSMIVALVAAGTIAFAMPRSAADELSAVTAPQSMIGAEFHRAQAMFASCTAEGK
ncbi:MULTISPECIES: hypothetical protein [unclassified Caballeronia]|uniref:hypothetical protein n=1 Tax=unclassified Caballeronia TaxID=2646786 RepID=UPI0028632CEA|nr:MULTISPECIES: hypothetical protein [unclassified Caballeronia]MDR5740903.1 hypothetical protein [Caballeronia sp. LZ016]MDR5808576.1 hypothetical protein [Caballeronia sp. LZ019]